MGASHARARRTFRVEVDGEEIPGGWQAQRNRMKDTSPADFVRHLMEQEPDMARTYTVLDTPPVNAIDAQVSDYVSCACGKRFHVADPKLQRILDATGELVFEGCNQCLCQRLQQSEQTAMLLTQIQRWQQLLREVVTPESWNDGPGLLTRLRTELAAGSGGGYVH